MTRTSVHLSTTTVGSCFATVGVIRSAQTGRVLAVTDEKPYGFDAAALTAAETLAEKRGYVVVAQEDE